MSNKIQAAVPLLRKQDVLNMAKKFIKDKDLAAEIAKGLTTPTQWPFVSGWPKQAWQDYFKKMAKGLEDASKEEAEEMAEEAMEEVKASADGLSQQEVLALATKLLKNKEWAAMTLEKMLEDKNWKFVKTWSEKTWTDFINKNAQNYMHLLSKPGKEASAAAETYLLLQAAATSLENGTPEHEVEQWVSSLTASVVQAVDIGKHPDLFSKEPTAVSIEDWKMTSPEDLLAAARSGVIPSDEDLEEMKELQEQAENDGDVDALLALGMSRRLADAVADGLVDQLYELDEEGREKRIEAFVKEFRERAEDDIKYETEGDGKESWFDGFQIDALHGRELKNVVKDVQEYLEEDEYPRRDDVTEEMLSEILADPDNYDFELNKNEYRSSPRAVWSRRLGSLEQERDGLEYDDELADLLRPLSEKDLKAAVEKLGNDSPYVSFGGSWRREVINKGYFEGSYNYRIGETEGWKWEAIPDMNKITEALNERLGVSEGQTADTEDVIYRYAGTNDTVAGASARGMYVVRLKPSQLGAEGAALGICVGRKDMPYCRRLKAGEIDLYSIRTESGKPKFTIEIDTVRNRIAQVKGKANRVPGFAAGGETNFAKPDDVRLATEFLLHLGFLPEAIRNAYDTAPGVKAMEDAGQDPFSPPPSKKRGELAASAELIAVNPMTRLLALKAFARPWGFGVEAAAAERIGPRRVVHYPEFEEWLTSLKDTDAVKAILKRLTRVKEEGFFGDHKLSIRTGLHQMRFDVGPGYRIYYIDKPHGDEQVVVLLNGGDKNTQDADIRSAITLMDPATKLLSDLPTKKEEQSEKKKFKDYGAEFMPKPMFAGVSDAELLAGGVPEKFISEIRSLLTGDEDGLLDVADRIPIEASAFLLDLAFKDKGSSLSGSVRIYCKLIEVKAKRLLV